MIEGKKITKRFGNKILFNEFDFKIEKGEFVCFSGVSGAGKTTLAKLLIAEEKPSKGVIEIGGWDITNIKKRDIPALRRQIGIVFQDFKLLQKKTVYENVAFALEVAGEPSRRIHEIIPQVMKIVGLEEKMGRYPQQLSGGEQQRVVVARALVHRPKVLLADEPTGNVDPETSIGIMNTFKDINARGATILVASHNKELIRQTGRRVLKLLNGDFLGEEIG